MKLPFPFKNSTETSSSFLWAPWPSCGNPKTLSFRASNDDMYKTINSAYVDATSSSSGVVESPEPCFTKTELDESENKEQIETVIRGLRSERLFFEAGESSSSIMEKAKTDGFVLKETTTSTSSVVMEILDSDDPYLDFKKSMEEMVEAHGLKDWECLEVLLTWYLRLNAKTNHAYIVQAFLDLFIIRLAANFLDSSSSTTTTLSDDDDDDDDAHDHSFSAATTTITHSLTLLSFSSSASSSTSPCLSSLLEAEDEIADN